MRTNDTEYYDAMETQKEYDHNRAELLSVALSIYAGHAASANGARTIGSCLSTAQRLLGLVDEKVGKRPELPDRPEF